MKFLIAIPALYNAEATRRCIESVIEKEADFILMDNGAEQSVKDVLAKYAGAPNVEIVSNPENVYVNPAWNFFIGKFFADNSYTHLIILNSDLILQKDWVSVLKTRLSVDPNEITLPIIKDAYPPDNVDADYSEGQTVYEGTPGVFICLSRLCAQLIYPIPNEIKVWFGDNWIFDCLRGMGFKTVIAPNLHSWHYQGGSQSVHKANVYDIIEQDKIAWRDIVEPKMRQKIAEFNNPQSV